MNSSVAICVLRGVCIVLGILIVIESQAQDCTVNAGVPINTCAAPYGSLTLTGLANDPNGSILGTNWTLTSGPNTPVIVNPTNLITTVTGYVIGTYVFRLTAQCSEGDFSFNEVTVNVTAPPFMPILPDTLKVCRTDTLQFEGPPGVDYSWNKVTGSTWSFRPRTGDSTVISNFSSSSSIYALFDGYYQVYLEATEGSCIIRDTFVICYNAADTIISAGADVAVCDNTWTKYANRDYFTPEHYSYPGFDATVEWNQLSGPNQSTINVSGDIKSVIFSNLVPGIYDFEYVVNQGEACGLTGRDTVQFIVSDENLSSLDFDGIVYDGICPGDASIFIDTELTLKPGESLSWVSQDCPHLTIPDTQAISNIVSGFIPCDRCNIDISLTNGICTSTKTYQIDAFEGDFPDQIINYICGGSNANPFFNTLGCNTGYKGPRENIFTVISSPDFPTGQVSTSTYGLSPGIHSWKGEIYIADGCLLDIVTRTYTISGDVPVANAGSDPFIPCGATSAVLTGNYAGPYLAGTWYEVSGPNTPMISDPNDNQPTLTGLVPGTYLYRWEINGGGCGSSYDDVTLLVADQPVPVPDAGTDINACYGDATTLSGDIPPPGSYGKWTVSPTGPTIQDINDPNTVVTGTLPNTAYTFTWTFTNSCSIESDDVLVTTNGTEGPNLADAGPDQCSFSTSNYTLDANAPTPTSATGTWNIISYPGTTAPTISNINDPTANLSQASTLGDYALEWVISVPGCNDSRDTMIISKASLLVSAGLDAYLCDTTATNLDGNFFGGAIWKEVIGPPGVIIADSTLGNSGVSFSLPGKYTFVSAAGSASCVRTDEVTISVSIAQTATAGRDTIICNNNAITLSADSVSGGFWDILQRPDPTNSPTFSDIFDPNTTVSNMEYGTYQFIWSAPSIDVAYMECMQKDTLDVSLIPVADAGSDIAICQTDNFLLKGNDPSNAALGSWSLISGPTTPTITSVNNRDAIVSNFYAGTYTFQYDITGSSCSSSDQMVLTIDSLHFADGGDDLNTCDPTIDLLGIAPPTGVNAQWILAGGPTGGSFGSPITDPINSYSPLLIESVYHFIYEVTNGACVSSEDIFVVTCEEYLPVELINFEVKDNGCSVDINWEAGSEEKFDRYEIELSTDNGLTFKKLHVLQPNGALKYFWNDDTANPGRNFYRLKMWDLDGSYKYSRVEIANVDCGNIKEEQFLIFPNPISPEEQTAVTVKLDLTGDYTLSVVNIYGHQLIELPLQLEEGWTSIQIPIDQFPSGTYFININSSFRQIKSKTLLIQE